MANLSDLKPSITELPEHERIALVLQSRQRRVGYKTKPKKKVNKKLLSKMSQIEKQQLLEMMEAANAQIT